MLAADILNTFYSVAALAAAFGIVLLGYSLLVRADLFREPTTASANPQNGSRLLWRAIPGAFFSIAGIAIVCVVLARHVFLPTALVSIPPETRVLLTEASRQNLSDAERTELRFWLEGSGNLQTETPTATGTPGS